MTISQRQARKMEADREELAERIAQMLSRNGVSEPQPGVHLSRFAHTNDPSHTVLEPCFCVIAQGAKTLTLGDDVFRYDPAHYAITTVGLPIVAEIVEASAARPYLGLRVTLDPSVVASVIVESQVKPPRGESGVRALDVSPLDADLLDATVRLLRLAERPDTEYRAVAPLVVREIVYRLLAGAQGSRMRQLASSGGQAHRMVRAIEKLRTNFDKPLRIESLAKELGMSLSGFHAHFKAVTAMSPLQYQKQIRLQEARRLMVSESPKPVYQIIVATLANSRTPLTTDQIASAVEAQLGTRPADFHVRVPLRLFMHVDPPLVLRARARYAPAAPETFVSSCAELWDKLRR